MAAVLQRLNGLLLISYHKVAGAEEIPGKRPLRIMLGYVFDFLPFRYPWPHPDPVVTANGVESFFADFKLEYQQVQPDTLPLAVRRTPHTLVGYVHRSHG